MNGVTYKKRIIIRPQEKFLRYLCIKKEFCMKRYICIDIGGTTIKYGVIQENGIFEMTKEMPTQAKEGGGAGIIDKIKRIVSAFLEQYEVSGICVSTAGMVDWKKGVITYASSLIPNYTGTKIKEIMENAFHLPCEVENDVNCAGLAEYYAGAGKGCESSLCLTIGTGIGGAFVSDGKIFHGFSGSGCEVGYLHLPGGAFQDLAASSVLVKNVIQKKGLKEGDLNGKMIFDKAKEGDRDCIEAIDTMCDILGMGIANLCYVLNPEIVVLGGGIMVQREYLEPKIRQSLKKYLLSSIAEHTKLAFAQNKNQAGMLGAYYHFKEQHVEGVDLLPAHKS